MRRKFDIRISDTHKAVTYCDISTGSQPSPRYFTMVTSSSSLAALGLMMNITAVVIGAILVAQLLPPIPGISLALVDETPKRPCMQVLADCSGGWR